MMLHRNAKLGLAGRHALVRAIERGLLAEGGRGRLQRVAGDGVPLVAPLARGRRGGAPSLACLQDRSSRPRRMPRLLRRRRSGGSARPAPHRLGPRLLTLRVGHPHSTISKVLRRHGLSRPPRPPREPARRYEWPCPGDLLHMDVARYARFRRPGHAVTGDRSQRSRRWMDAGTRVGYDYAHAIVDDHSRLAYVELLDDERAATVTAFVERALASFAEHGITGKRLITDNAWAYTHNRSLRELLARRSIRHLTDRALPTTHERQGRTLPPDDGTRMGLRPPLPHRIDTAPRALPHWLRHYNERRPHSSLGGPPPISRVHNLCGQDS